MSTIKVEPELRDRINAEAASLGTTAGGLVQQLVDAYQRHQRMVAFGRAFKTADQSYWNELALWDAAISDGLDDA